MNRLKAWLDVVFSDFTNCKNSHKPAVLLANRFQRAKNRGNNSISLNCLDKNKGNKMVTDLAQRFEQLNEIGASLSNEKNIKRMKFN